MNKYLKYLFLTLAVFISMSKMYVPEKSGSENTNIENTSSGYINSNTKEIFYFEATDSNKWEGLLRIHEVSLQNFTRTSEISGDTFRSFRKTVTDQILFEQFRKVYIRKQTSQFYDGYYIYQLRKLLI